VKREREREREDQPERERISQARGLVFAACSATVIHGESGKCL